MKRIFISCLFVVLSALVIVGCKKDKDLPIPPSSDSTNIALVGPITSDMTLSPDHTYTINEEVCVEGGAILLILPGTTLQFGPEGGLNIGCSSPGTLIADGGPTDSIVFIGNQWKGIHFEDYAVNSLVSFCRIEDAVSGEYAVTISRCEVSFDHNTILSVQKSGILVETYGETGLFSSFDSNVVSVSNWPLVIDARFVHKLGTGNIFTSSNNNGIMVSGDLVDHGPAVWKNHGIPYYIMTCITIDNVSMTLDDGCELKFVSGSGMIVGTNHNTTFVAQNVIFTAAYGGQWWSGLIFGKYSVGCVLDGCHVTYGGEAASYPANITIECPITVKGTEIAYSTRYGIWSVMNDAEECPDLDPSSINNTMHDNSLGDNGSLCQ